MEYSKEFFTQLVEEKGITLDQFAMVYNSLAEGERDFEVTQCMRYLLFDESKIEIHLTEELLQKVISYIERLNKIRAAQLLKTTEYMN